MKFITLDIGDYPFKRTFPSPDEPEAFWVMNHPKGVYFDGEFAYELAADIRYKDAGYSSDGMRRTGNGEYLEYCPGPRCENLPDKILADLKFQYNMSDAERRHYNQRKSWKRDAEDTAYMAGRCGFEVDLCGERKTLLAWRKGVDVGYRRPDEREEILLAACGLAFFEGSERGRGRHYIAAKEA